MKEIRVGINGLGRIGKCVFLQLLELEHFKIAAINTGLSLDSLGRYIKWDSVHGKRNYSTNAVEDKLIIKNNTITIINSRIPGEINWRELGVDYLFETTGSFLTREKLKPHPVDYIILSSPPKDDIKMFCFGVNHNDYSGENIVSCASCTTNCIVPILDFIEKNTGGIEEGSFITVHSATSSQSVVDTAKDKKRTNRSIFNNIIPHTTGASKSIDKILPSLSGKLTGTSVRVPVSNVSMIDLNIRFKTYMNKELFFSKLEKISDNTLIIVNKENCVSSDFIGCDAPCIVDYNSTMEISDKSLKIGIWYDNEWSYSAQMIRMCEHMSSI